MWSDNAYGGGKRCLYADWGRFIATKLAYGTWQIRDNLGGGTWQTTGSLPGTSWVEQCRRRAPWYMPDCCRAVVMSGAFVHTVWHVWHRKDTGELATLTVPFNAVDAKAFAKDNNGTSARVEYSERILIIRAACGLDRDTPKWVVEDWLRDHDAETKL